MTAQQQTTFAILVDGLWSGQVSERELFEVGLQAGIPAEKLNAVLQEVREMDGVSQ